MTIDSVAITVETHFLAQVEDTTMWEDRFTLLVSELNEEYGSYFLWSSPNPSTAADIVFVLYPPGYHDDIITNRALESYILTQSDRATYVHVIVIGRNPKNVKVKSPNVVDIVNDQCIKPFGIKAQGLRAIRPEDLDDEVKATLVRLLARRRGGIPHPPDEMPLAPSLGVTESTHSPTPPYERSDL